MGNHPTKLQHEGALPPNGEDRASYEDEDWDGSDAEGDEARVGPIHTPSGKERAEIDESTLDEADDDDDVDDEDEDTELEGDMDFRSSLVDVGREESNPSAQGKKDKKTDSVKNTVHKGRYFEVESVDVMDPTTGKRVETVSKVLIFLIISFSFLSVNCFISSSFLIKYMAGNYQGRDAGGNAAVVRRHADLRRRIVQAGGHLPLAEEASLLPS